MKVHELKILPEYFEEVVRGTKSFEIRKNDRDYKLGDLLLLKEWNGEKFTTKQARFIITYILNDDSGFVLEGYVIMSIERVWL